MGTTSSRLSMRLRADVEIGSAAEDWCGGNWHGRWPRDPLHVRPKIPRWAFRGVFFKRCGGNGTSADADVFGAMLTAPDGWRCTFDSRSLPGSAKIVMQAHRRCARSLPPPNQSVLIGHPICIPEIPRMFARFIALGIISGVVFTGSSDLLGAEPGHTYASGLRCESMLAPLAVAESSPRLSWIIEADRRNERQVAYRILVASTSAALDKNEGDLWDTGRVASDVTVYVPYTGKQLSSRQSCYWKVMTWDRDAAPSVWSAPAYWQMGLLKPTDWEAQWIEAGATPVPIEIISASYETLNGAIKKDVTAEVAAMAGSGEAIIASNSKLGGDPAKDNLKQLIINYRWEGEARSTTVAENKNASFPQSPVPYLRKTFIASKPVASARLYATALGIYETFLNGKKIGDHELAPGWTDYSKRVLYQTYDVTSQVAAGNNTLGAVVAPGWFAGRAGLFHARAFWGKTPALLAQLEINYTDGTTDRIVSDGSWQRHDGPILSTDMMDGEHYDATKAIAGWCDAAATGTGWTAVTTRLESRLLESQADHPVRIVGQLPSRSVTEPKPGHWIFDVSQNMVGVVRIKVSEKPGTVLTLRHGELLNPDGTLYTANLRGAPATDTYICKGGGPEQWQPAFTTHGFRYVELTGLQATPTMETVTGIVMASDLPETGTFTSSDASLNQLQSNIVWGQRGNYLSIPTDCPQRDERMGWMADTQVFVPTAAFNANVAPFMAKWMIDVDHSQQADGAHSDVAPVMKGLNFGTPAWADAGTIVPWTMYQMYGDTRILERHLDSMTKWVEWCRRNSTGLIRDKNRGNDYGDWLSIGADTPKDLIGTAYFARSTDILARSLAVLGRDAEARKYRELFEQIKAAFIGKYVKANGQIFGDTQCCYVLALRFDLLPETLRTNAVDRLVADIKAKGWHLSTGFVGVGMLLPTLSDAGRSDVAYRLLMQDSFPSWLFSVRHGATTIWERWDGWTVEGGAHPDIGMNSFNHYSLGSCGQWLFSGVGGIEPDDAHPGFTRFTIRPQIDGPLTHADTAFTSIHGRIATNWKRDGDAVTLKVTIPANTTAAVVLPARSGEEVTESGRPLETADGVKLTRSAAATVTLALGSGTFEFAWKHPAEGQ